MTLPLVGPLLDNKKKFCSLIVVNSFFVLYLMCCFGNNPLYMDFRPIKILFCSVLFCSVLFPFTKFYEIQYSFPYNSLSNNGNKNINIKFSDKSVMFSTRSNMPEYTIHTKKNWWLLIAGCFVVLTHGWHEHRDPMLIYVCCVRHIF